MAPLKISAFDPGAAYRGHSSSPQEVRYDHSQCMLHQNTKKKPMKFDASFSYNGHPSQKPHQQHHQQMPERPNDIQMNDNSAPPADANDNAELAVSCFKLCCALASSSSD